MRADSLILSIALVAGAGLAGCQSSAPGGHAGDFIPHLDAEAARAAGLSAGTIDQAGELYAVKCAKCHKFYDPAAYSEKDWDMWMGKMSRKAKLNPEQDELLRRYLGVFRVKSSPAP